MSKNTMSKKNPGSVTNTELKKKEKKIQNIEHDNENIITTTLNTEIQQASQNTKQKSVTKKTKNTLKNYQLIFLVMI